MSLLEGNFNLHTSSSCRFYARLYFDTQHSRWQPLQHVVHWLHLRVSTLTASQCESFCPMDAMKQAFRCCFVSRRLMAFQQGYHAAKPPLCLQYNTARGVNFQFYLQGKKKKKIKKKNPISLPSPSHICHPCQSSGTRLSEGGRLIPGVIPGPSSCTRAALQACLALAVGFVSCSIFFCSMSMRTENLILPSKSHWNMDDLSLWRHNLSRLHKNLSPSLISPLFAKHFVFCSASCLAAQSAFSPSATFRPALKIFY